MSAPNATPLTRREIAIAVHAAAVAGVDPRTATARALAARLPPSPPVWIISLGKASILMAEAAVTVLRDAHVEIAGGIVVPPADGPSPHERLTVVVGDHPVPNAASRAAADAIGALTERIAGQGTVFVLLSGGATSLVAAPVDAVSERDLTWMFDALLTSGADITDDERDPQALHAVGCGPSRASARTGARALPHRVGRRWQ